MTRSTWLALVARGRSSPGLRGPEPVAYAHTSPVWVEVDGIPPVRTSDARWCLDWLARFEELARSHGSFADACQLEDLERVIGEARSVYDRIADRASTGPRTAVYDETTISFNERTLRVTSRILVDVTALPGGAAMTTVTAPAPGHTVALLGGVHGDEDLGVLAVQRILHELAGGLIAGQVRAVAPGNPLAWAANSRTTPHDDDNLARSFPGDPAGSPTAVLAAGIAREVIEPADLLIDLHSASKGYQMPLFSGFTRASAAAAASERAARAFGAPLLWVHSELPPGRSLSVAGARGIPAIYVEGAGGGLILDRELDVYVNGVLSVLADRGMVGPGRRLPPSVEREVYGGGDLDEGAQAGSHGLFVVSTEAGAVVVAGEEIGRLYEYDGRLIRNVVSPRESVIMFLRREARTRADDVLFALADLTDDAG